MLRGKDGVDRGKEDEAVLDELLKGCERPEDLMADGGVMKELR
jgi:putative transposase